MILSLSVSKTKQAVQYGNVLMTFSISVSGPEQLLLYPELWVSKLMPRVSIPEHRLSRD